MPYLDDLTFRFLCVLGVFHVLFDLYLFHNNHETVICMFLSHSQHTGQAAIEGLMQTTNEDKMSLVMRKSAFCICENKDADQLRGNREADQRLCFRYVDSTIPLLPKCEISSI